jgi:hypothetical protein
MALHSCTLQSKRGDEGQSSQSKRDFSIGFAITRSRDLLPRLIREHAPDDARGQLAERVVEHLEASGFEVDDNWRAAGAGRMGTPVLGTDWQMPDAPWRSLDFGAYRRL